MKEWFENKTVSLVGNAKSLLSQSYGKQIDSSDVVIRLNKSFHILPPLSTKYFRSHGERIDVLFVNLIRTVKLRSRPYKETKIVQVTHCPVPPEFSKIVDFIIPPEIAIPFNSQFVAKPSVGIRVMNYLIQCDPKQINVFGFDWKKTPSFFGRDIMNIEEHDFEFEKEYWGNNFLNKEYVFIYS